MIVQHVSIHVVLRGGGGKAWRCFLFLFLFCLSGWIWVDLGMDLGMQCSQRRYEQKQHDLLFEYMLDTCQVPLAASPRNTETPYPLVRDRHVKRSSCNLIFLSCSLAWKAEGFA